MTGHLFRETSTAGSISCALRRSSTLIASLLLTASASVAETSAPAPDATKLKALHLLAPMSALGNTEPGKKALAANFTITHRIQTGAAHQPILLPFHSQQQQALRDTFITGANANDLADGLGSTLGAIYQAGTAYTSTDDGNSSSFADTVSPAVTKLMTYANALTRSDAGAGKFFFANATDDGTKPASSDEMAILNDVNGTTDVYGKAYNKVAGSDGADKFGNSRPFQTEPSLTPIKGKDYFGVASTNDAYLHGPAQNLTNSPSFPSGHTTYGYTQSLLLAILIPQRYPQMVARAAEYGNDRIVLGAHYTMDVLAGRTLATYDVAQMLANKQGYAGLKKGGVEIDDFQKTLTDARADLVKAFETGCHHSIVNCARRDKSRFARAAKNQAFYEATQTYGLPVVYEKTANGKEDVATLAPEAGYLLTTAFPYLTLDQANAILTSTEGPGGRFLDDGSGFGVYSRLDLYRAAQKAIAMAPKK